MKCAVVRQNGGFRLQINGETLLPLAYMTYHPDEAVYRSQRENGCRIFSFGVYAGDRGINSYSNIRPFGQGFWRGKNSYCFDEVAADLKKMAPDGQVCYLLPRVYLDCPLWWEKEHPNELCRDFRGNPLRQSFSSEIWKNEAWSALRALVDFIEASPWRDLVIGYQVAAGGTEEWVYHWQFPGQLSDYSAPARAAFAEAVGDPKAEIPSPIQRRLCEGGLLRNPETEQRMIDYYGFHSEVIAKTILCFCQKLKEYTGKRLLTGAFYGYTGELMNQETGHHALRLLLESPDVDFLASPHSYAGGRKAGMDWPYMGPVDSAALHRKLWFLESDVRTCCTTLLRETMPQSVPDNTMYDGGVWKGPDTPEQSLSMMKKAFGRVLCGPAGSWWFDMWGGWFERPELLKLLADSQKWMADQTEGPLYPEIAVVVDEEGYRHLAVDHPYLYQMVYEQRQELGKTGAPYRFFLANDLNNPDFHPEDYKMIVLLGVVRPSEAVRQGIKRLQGGGRMLVWSGFPDAEQFSGGSLTGLLWQYDKAFSETQAVYRGKMFPTVPVGCPRFSGQDAGTPLARFTDNTPAVMLKDCGDWISVVSLAPALPAQLFADLAVLQGVHLYAGSGDVIYAGGRYVVFHAVLTGEKRLYFPPEITVATDAETGKELPYREQMTDFYLTAGETRVLRVEAERKGIEA